jgi:FAD/FMN-containing dehydrogenase
VVTEFEFRLHETRTTALLIDNTVDLAEALSAMRRWRDLLGEDVPPQATPVAWAGTMTDSPEVLAQARNRAVASLGFVWVGDPHQGRRLARQVEGLGMPLAERAGELSYLRLQTMDEWHRPGARRRYFKGHYLAELSDEAIDAFLSQGEPDPAADRSRLPGGALQGYGAAIAATSDDDSAFSHRNALVEFVAATGWTDPTEDDQRIGAAPTFGAAIEPYASGVYINVLADEGESGVRRAYPADKLARLATLKRHYDPDNVLHLNQNIRPEQ